MGLDVYAGTYVRYHAMNWKTATQLFCEQNGIKYNVVRAETSGETASVEEITEGVHEWMDAMGRMLEGHGFTGFAPWEENNVKDYFTDKPDWDAFGALLLMAAAKALGREFPKEYKKKMEFHPMIEEAANSVFSEWSLFMGVCHFVPYDQFVVFDWCLANGAEVTFAALANLREELSTINRILWDADEETILRWHETEGYPADGYFKDGKFVRTGEHDVYDTESLAKFAFAVLYKALRFAEINRTPVILDF